MQKELQHFHDCRFFEPKNPCDLDYEQWKKSLSYLIFLKHNNDEVMIKVLGYADVRNQKDWLFKEDTVLSTVFTEGLMMLWTIADMEVWYVSTVDIPKPFLKTDHDKLYMHIKMDGVMVDLLEGIETEY